jgi:hypothetical protein
MPFRHESHPFPWRTTGEKPVIAAVCNDGFRIDGIEGVSITFVDASGKSPTRR